MSISTSARAPIVGITNEYQPNVGLTAAQLPVQIGVIASGNTGVTYDIEPAQYFNSGEVATVFGSGSPAHLIAKQLWPDFGTGVGAVPVTFYPMADGTTASTGTITPLADQTVTTSYKVVASGIETDSFSIDSAATVADACDAIVAAINATPDFPMTAADGATVVNLTSKFKGVIANAIKISIVAESTGAGTFTLGQPAGGAGDPDITDALNIIDSRWETGFIVALAESTTWIDLAEAKGVERWSDTVKTPAKFYYGSNGYTFATEITVPDSRASAYNVVKLVFPDAAELPFVCAAAGVRAIAVIQNDGEKFANDYTGAKVFGLTPGLRSRQWSWAVRDNLIKKGVSTVTLVDGVYNLDSVVSFYHPTANVIAELRKVVDLHKLMIVLYNERLIFEGGNWLGRPLVKDTSNSTNTQAKRPKDAKTDIKAMLNALERSAVVVDAEATAKLTYADISGTNPNYLEVRVYPKLSGSVDIIDVLNKWSFNFGG